MLKTVSTLALVLGLAATGCSKKKDAPAGDKPATTTEAAKPTENKAADTKPTEAPKTEEAKAAPAAAGEIKTDDEYIASGKAALAKITETFKAAGKDCAKLATELNAMANDPKYQASAAYEKAHPDVKKKFDEATKAETEAFMAAAGPAIQSCMEDKAFGEAIQKLGD